MNNRFKLAFTLLTTRQTQKGFTIMLCFAIGAIMLLTGAVILTRATQGKETAAAQKKKVEATSIVEAGITQYMNVLNNNKKMATYPACLSPRNSDGTCPPSDSVQDWTDAVAITNASDPAVVWPSHYCSNTNTDQSAKTVYTDPAYIASTWSKNDWKSLGSNGGEFKMVGYGYKPDNPSNGANSTPGTATLILRGKSNTNENNAGLSQVEVTFRVTGDTEGKKFFNKVPGLWAQHFSLSGTNTTNDFRTNVLDSGDCQTLTTSDSTEMAARVAGETLLNPPFAANTPASYDRQKQSFPDLPNNNVYAAPTANFNEMCLGQLGGDRVFPQSGDVASDGKVYGSTNPPAANATYLYVHKSSCSSEKSRLQGTERHIYGVSGQETIKIYSASPIDISGGGGVTVTTNGSNTTKAIWYMNNNLTVGGSGYVSAAKYLQIYVYGARTINIHGNPSVNAFIFAPESTATFSGSQDFKGAVWVKNYDDNGTAGSVVQTLTDADLDFLEVNVPEPLEAFAMSTINSYTTTEVADVVSP